jgi:hypothetical protein
MRIFYYNSFASLYHLEEDYGTIDSPPDEMVDNGNLNDEVDYEENEIISEPGEIKNNCSLFKVRGKSIAKKISSPFASRKDLNTDDIVFSGIVLMWIGFGTAFELDNGSERISCPYLASGTAR